MTDPIAVDALIVGGGPAGLSTALTLARSAHSGAVFDSGKYRNAQSLHMHMVPTWDHQDPAAYREAARKELAERYKHIRLVDHAVTAARRDTTSGLFVVEDATGQKWTGKKLVLALGVQDVKSEIDGYAECWATGIFHCLFCHGYEERGAASAGVLAADLMADMPAATDGLVRNAYQFADSVTVYTNGSEDVANKLRPMLVKKKAKFDTRRIRSLRKDAEGTRVTVTFEDGESVTEAFLVYAPRNRIDLEFAKDLNLEKSPSGGELKVTAPFNETTEPGCFAAGDISFPAKAASLAISSGSIVAVGVVKQLQAD